MNLTRQPARIARSWWIFALLATLAMAAGLFAAQETFKRAAVEALGDDTEGDAELKRSLLLAVLDRSRALPLVLAGDAELAAGLANPDVPAISRLNSKLETLAARTQASVIYVIARDGTAIAASNWRQADSFVGSNYGFRDYFTSAMEAGTAEQYALGTVSRRPGLYIAHRVTAADGQALGVVVVKVEFDALEESWRRSNRITFVTDSRGVVLITSRPDWRFFTTSDIPPHELGALRDSLQFGEAPLTPIPIWSLYDDDGHAWVASEGTGSMPSEQFLRVDMEVGGAPWTLHVLAPANTAVEAGMWQGRLLAFALIMPLIGIAAFLLYRSGRSARQRALEQAAREELERQVTLRTVELTEARDRLEAEIAEHHATDIRLQGVQQDLVQANRLAILGQVAAGVAHEINQPVATIRAYADNAKAFLDRGNGETAKENLGLIAELTERIGSITGELKGLARKGRQAAEPVELKAAIDGALFLLKSRFAGSFDRLKIGDIPADIKVLGQRIRLEQVLINLLQNALEAIEGKADAAINIGLSRLTDDELDLAVSDTGPGLPEHVRDNLFIPFTTSKEGGLGLGLVIARDIVTEYGGRISVESSAAGTTFTITLKRANV